LPEKVVATHTVFNKIDTIVSCQGTIYFSNNRIGNFECGCLRPHRAKFEIVGKNGVITVEDFVGGQGKTGNIDAYFVNFIGSGYYKQEDVSGKEK